MRVAVGLPQISDDVAGVLRAAREAEDAGAWGVWVFDNLSPIARPDRPALEGWSLLAAVARATSRVRLVSLVTRAGLRPAPLVASMAAVVQAAGGGRLVLGLGVGDAASRREEERFGVTAPEVRADRLQAATDIIEAVREPRAPVRPVSGAGPPVWIGGGGADVLDLAGRLGDGWHGWGLSAAEFSDRVARLRAACGADFPCWWGGMFDPTTASGISDELRHAGATGITWMIRSTDEPRYRRALLDSLA